MRCDRVIEFVNRHIACREAQSKGIATDRQLVFRVGDLIHAVFCENGLDAFRNGTCPG